MESLYEKQKFKVWLLIWLLIIFYLLYSTIETSDFEFSDFFGVLTGVALSPLIWLISIGPFVVIWPNAVYDLGRDHGYDMPFVEFYKGDYIEKIELVKNKGEKKFMVMGSDFQTVFLPTDIKIDRLKEVYPHSFNKEWWLHEKGNIKSKQETLVILTSYCISLALSIYFFSEAFAWMMLSVTLTYLTFKFYEWGFDKGYYQGLLALRDFGHKEDEHR